MRRPNHGGNLAWAGAIAGCPPSSILDFSASINPLGPPKSVIAAIESQLKGLISYPDPNYCSLRQSLSQLHPNLNPDSIVPGNGSAELLTWAGRELAQLEETYLLTPAFSDYQRALKAFGANVTACRLRDWECSTAKGNSKSLGNADINPTRAIAPGLLPIPNSKPPIPNRRGLLLNNPHNPTGKLFARETIEPLLEQFALVVIDEAFMDFLPPEKQQSLIPLVHDYSNLVILRSLTKFYSLPGLRLGYGVTNPERIRHWQQWRDPWPVNCLAVAAAAAAVVDSEFQQQTWQWLPAARWQLFQGLAQLPGLQPHQSAANFLLVQSQQSSSQIQEQLLKHSRCLIRDCLSFPELGDRYFRVAVRTQSDNQCLLEGLEAILNQGDRSLRVRRQKHR
ncbi:MAG: threonine-phosphate decarboxylase [Symploca sp. SIO3C6]|nr:threonine-phosphate decarboxylase [Symploca sp. SIO3C6]NET06704.1 threonine-phosphate decarboxylase [Symploca sp. SIO2B6]NET50369.1 threonine-phosphate decarboxylase [Merismopedia sp. SIO2A8]